MHKLLRYAAILGAVAVIFFVADSVRAEVATPTDINGAPLRDGDLISANQSAGDPDIFIVKIKPFDTYNGFKRLFLNPAIFKMYSHLGGFERVRQVSSQVRESFVTSGLFRNCESNDQKVWATEVTSEDSGVLHHVQMTGDQAVNEDPYFFDKVFCINNREDAFYARSISPYIRLMDVPRYHRGPSIAPSPTPYWTPGPSPVSWNRIDKSNFGFGFSLPATFIEGRIDYDRQVFAASLPGAGSMLIYVQSGALGASHTSYPSIPVGSQTGYLIDAAIPQQLGPQYTGAPATCYVKRIYTALPESKHLEIIFNSCTNSVDRQGVTTPLLTDQTDLIRTILSNFTFIYPATPTPTPLPTPSIYSNNDIGFRVTLSSAWSGYWTTYFQSQAGGRSIDFWKNWRNANGTTTQLSPFRIGRMSQTEWDNRHPNSRYEIIIKQTTDYIYYYGVGVSTPSGMLDMDAAIVDIPNIIATFQQL